MKEGEGQETLTRQGVFFASTLRAAPHNQTSVNIATHNPNRIPQERDQTDCEDEENKRELTLQLLRRQQIMMSVLAIHFRTPPRSKIKVIARPGRQFIEWLKSQKKRISLRCPSEQASTKRRREELRNERTFLATLTPFFFPL